MTDFASLGIKIDSSEVRRGTADLNEMSRAGARAEKSTDSLAGVMRGMKGLFAGVVTGEALRRFVQTADAFNSMNARLMLVTRSTNEFVAAQRALFNISQQTRVGLEQTADLFGSISRSTESLGVSQDQVLRVTETINKALIVSGASAMSAQAALVQLGQGFAAGALRGEELNSVLEQTPRLARAIADGLGVPLGRLRELGAAGKLTGEQVFQALTKSAKGIDAEFAKMPLTVDQATTQAANSWTVLIGAIDETTNATRSLAEVISGTAVTVGGFADELKRAAQGDESVGFLAKAFQIVTETVKVLWAEFQFGIKAAGIGAGALLASLQAIINLDMTGFNAISRAMAEDIARARKEVNAYASSVLVMGRLDLSPDNQSDAEARRLGLIGPTPIRVRQPGAPDKNKKDGIREAKLAADLAEYRRQLADFTAAFSAEEAILEARRSAGLVNETAYYDKKVDLVQRQNNALIQALEAERNRLQAEKTTGAEAIKNATRIADLEAEISRARKQAANEIDVLGIRHEDSMRKVELAFRNAREAADAYVDSIRSANNRDLAGMGRGNLQREQDARRNQRDDEFLARRRELSGQLRAGEIDETQYQKYLEIERAAHEQALAEDARYWAAKLELSRNWSIGALEALQNYYDQSQDIASQINQAFTNAFQGMEDALVNFIQTGKLDFKSLADSIIADITRIIIKQQIMAPLAQSLMGGMGGGSGAGGFLSDFFGGLFANAKGGVYSSPGLSAYSGQVVSRPTLFPFAKGIGLMGEAGPEAILPLKRGPDGRLGVESGANGGGGGGGTVVNLTVAPPAGSNRSTATQWGAQVGRQIDMAMRRNG